MTSSGLPTHAICPHCGVLSEKFHPWVYAHWREPLVGPCKACGKQHGLQNGVAYILKGKGSCGK